MSRSIRSRRRQEGGRWMGRSRTRRRGSAGVSGSMEIGVVSEEVRSLVDAWIREVEDCTGLYDKEDLPQVWDDVHGGALPLKEVTSARKEEIQFMQPRGICLGGETAGRMLEENRKGVNRDSMDIYKSRR